MIVASTIDTASDARIKTLGINEGESQDDFIKRSNSVLSDAMKRYDYTISDVFLYFYDEHLNIIPSLQNS